MTTTAEHLRNSLDGRFRDVKNRVRRELSNEIFRPHYTPNTVIARTKVACLLYTSPSPRDRS